MRQFTPILPLMRSHNLATIRSYNLSNNVYKLKHRNGSIIEKVLYNSKLFTAIDAMTLTASSSA
jgi:hypothetical protein